LDLFTTNDFDLKRTRTLLTTSRQDLDEVSYEFLFDTRKWYVIGEINWPTIDDPLDLPDAKTVLIPSAEQVFD